MCAAGSAKAAIGRAHAARGSAGFDEKERPKQMNVLTGIYQLGDTLLALYGWAIIISAIMSWLIAFNVINTSNQFVYQVMDMLHRITQPVLRPIRRIIPDLGGIDISPILLYLGIQFLARPLWADLMSFIIRSVG